MYAQVQTLIFYFRDPNGNVAIVSGRDGCTCVFPGTSMHKRVETCFSSVDVSYLGMLYWRDFNLMMSGTQKCQA